jgi:hypothetical protein
VVVIATVPAVGTGTGKGAATVVASVVGGEGFLQYPREGDNVTGEVCVVGVPRRFVPSPTPELSN